jgi:hypothetical protein
MLHHQSQSSDYGMTAASLVEPVSRGAQNQPLGGA